MIDAAAAHTAPHAEAERDSEVLKKRGFPEDNPELIDARSAHQPSGLPDVPALDPEDNTQHLLDHNKKMKLPDIDDQFGIHSEAKTRPLDDYIDQMNIEGEAESPPAEMQPKRSLQPDDQELIDAQSAHQASGLPDVPPLDPEDNTQHLLDRNKKRDLPNINDQFAIHAEAKTRPLDEYTDQMNIEGEAESPPAEMQPKRSLQPDDQQLIDAQSAHQASGLPDVPPLDPEDNTQHLLDRNKKRELPDINDQFGIHAEAKTRPLDEYTDQINIEAEAESPPAEMQPKKALQTPINSQNRKTATNHTLPPTLSFFDRFERLLDRARKKAELDFPDEVRIDAEAHAEEIKLQETERLKPDLTNDQVLLEAQKGVVAPLEIEPTNDQVLLSHTGKSIFNEQSKPIASLEKQTSSYQQNLLTAAHDVAKSLEKMLKSAEGDKPNIAKKKGGQSVFGEANKLLDELNKLNKMLADNLHETKPKKDLKKDK